MKTKAAKRPASTGPPSRSWTARSSRTPGRSSCRRCCTRWSITADRRTSPRPSSCTARCRRSAPSPVRLAQLAAQLKEEPVGAGLLIVGRVVNFREHLRWFDSRPLFGRRALVMHSNEQPDDLADLLRSHGAEVIDDSDTHVDIYRQLLDRRIDLVTFTSASAVLSFAANFGADQASDLLTAHRGRDPGRGRRRRRGARQYLARCRASRRSARAVRRSDRDQVQRKLMKRTGHGSTEARRFLWVEQRRVPCFRVSVARTLSYYTRTSACSTTPPGVTAPSFDVLITNAQIVDGSGGAPHHGIDRDQRRQDRGGGRGDRHRGPHDRRQGPHRGPGLHRPAQPFRHDADYGRQRPEQDSPGRDHGGDRRIRFGRATQIAVRRRGVDGLHRLLRGDREGRHLAQPAVVRRHRHRARNGDRRGRSQGDAG